MRGTVIAAIAAIAMSAAACNDEASLLPAEPAPPEAPAPASALTASLATSTVQVGATTQATATVRSSDGEVLNGQQVGWSSSDTAVATVDASGLVTARSAGTAKIIASVSDKAAEAVVTVTTAAVTPPPGPTNPPAPPPGSTNPPPPAASGSNPAPGAGDRLVLDTRTTLQQATSEAAALALFPDHSSGIGFTADMDGKGTNAFRFEWAKASECVDNGKNLVHYIDGTKPKRLFMQWKMRMGRTATGGGIGAQDSFQLTNAACGNAARKMFLVLRDVPDQGAYNRIDYIWPGPAPINPRFEGQGMRDGALGMNKVTFQPQSYVAQELTQTIYLQAESSAGARDGVVRLWVNGQLVAEHLNISTGPEGFHRFQLPTVFRAPAQDQTEYIWDVMAWEPK